MSLIADLHIHSRYSRATSRDLDLERLAWWAARKGIDVLATGDCVHPAWLAEIKEKLVPDGRGLFRLKPEIEAGLFETLPVACRRPVRFMLSTEISTIYKKGDKTRKVHHLIYAPDLETADALAAKLARVGNIVSDGRPILGLDSRDLLEIALESGPGAYLVPAHIWTPWFAAMGSRSGFDSIADCYGDLADHVFAVETGLSSDPAMNWRVSSLDRYRLVSNSDAHSPAKLGREATRFSCEADYFVIRRALETGDGYVGTLEFFPEEGKYHMDGHRACDVRLTPKETIELGGICPVCGRPVTVGVAHRVESLADRAEEGLVPPVTAGRVESYVPLAEMVSELVGCGSASKSVGQAYDRLTAELGPELEVLASVPVEDIAKTNPLLGEAVTRLRSGDVIRQPGYDGEYGVIRLFTPDELASRNRGEMLFDAPVRQRVKPKAKVKKEEAGALDEAPKVVAFPAAKRQGVLAALDEDQAAAAEKGDGPLIVIAGPGSGKTRMLTHRIAHLVLECGVPARHCLAVTFTRRATEELRARLALLLPDQAKDCAIFSFHALGLTILRAHYEAAGLAKDFRIASEAERVQALASALDVGQREAVRLVKAVSVLKRTGATGEGQEAAALEVLGRLSRQGGWVDYDDLIGMAVALLEKDEAIAALWQKKFSAICADEFQDVDEAQYKLLRLLAGTRGNLCVIGDPDQAIYGFRGADASCFDRFAADYPAASCVRLARNYRSSGTIVTASGALMGREAPSTILRPMGEKIVLHSAASEKAEAVFVSAMIEALMGGHTLLTVQQRRKETLSFGDFAVLYRTDAQAAALREALDRQGIPFKKSTPLLLVEHTGVQALLRALSKEMSGEVSLAVRIEAAQALAVAQEWASVEEVAQAKAWTAAVLKEDPAMDEAGLREVMALSNEADFFDERADRVSLLTMHAAKGLEFPVVFVVGMEEGMMPYAYGEQDPAPKEVEAERRLLYVAMTRAMDRLFLSGARERFWHGQRRSAPSSRFLEAIPSALTERLDAPRRAARAKQYNLF
ncbi:MAG: UvrD-helicase domain-containing protein [Bdellovibrionales bacterium]